MLTSSAKRKSDSYSFPFGMLNSGYLGGVLRKPGDGICYIQRTRNEDHLLPVHFDPKKSPIPPHIKEGDLVMAICHVLGGLENGHRPVRMRAVHFESPNTMHMDKSYTESIVKEWSKFVPETSPQSETPESIATLQRTLGALSTEEKLSRIDFRVIGLNANASNNVRIAGFIQAKMLERNRVNAEGKPISDRLVVLLRQTPDPAECIAIRWYGRNLEPLAEKLRKGLPIMVTAQYRVDAKELGTPDPESGERPILRIPFLEANDYPQACKTDSPYIKVVPAWALELLKEGMSGPSKVVPQLLPVEPSELGVDRSAIFASTFGNSNQPPA